ncbi:MAG: hypothetical protein J6K89_08575 [Oscillospiraceae bacterium]|nr:hypothetical protein [Oscillospiraceae bacterium]
MKRTRLCPKCNSSDLLRIEGNVGAYGVGNNIMTGATVFSAVKVHRYVCCSCGFTEEWIDTADIEKLRNSKKSTKV